MKISIIIPTYNGAGRITNILRSLEEQTYKIDEVVVVVDGSTDNTNEVLNNIKCALTLRVIYQPNKGRASARNCGFYNATGDYIFFFDDDIRLLPDTLQLHMQHAKKFKDSIITGPARFDKSKIEHDDFSKFRAQVEEKWLSDFGACLKQVTLENYVFTTQNLSLPRKIFELLGGFDERLTDSEDFDLSLQAILKGVNIYFDPNIQVWHDDFISIERYINRQVEYVISKKKLAQLKPAYINMHKASFEYATRKKSIFIRGIMCIFQFNKLWETVLASPMFRRIPAYLRYKIYDWIVISSMMQKLKS